MGTRDRIVAAAEQVIREQGLARATTKEIARAASCSEALLYKHFSRKEEIILAVLLERGPGLGHALARLTDRLGRGTVAGNLEEFAGAAIRFFRAVLPLGAGLLTERALLSEFRAMLGETGMGPHLPIVHLARYLREEQRLGRLGAHAKPEAAAALLLGACFHRAFLGNFSDLGSDDAFAVDLVAALFAGLAPA